MSLKYSSQPSLPVKVFARKGRRERAHSGPCSVILGLLEKYCDRSSDGGGGEIRAAQNPDVTLRSVELRVEAMPGGVQRCVRKRAF